MVLLFYVDDCQMFSPYKDKIDEVYAPIKTDFKIEDDREINKYIGIDLDHRPYVSIHLSQPYLTQSILNMIPGIVKSNAKPTPAVNPSHQKK